MYTKTRLLTIFLSFLFAQAAEAQSELRFEQKSKVSQLERIRNALSQPKTQPPIVNPIRLASAELPKRTENPLRVSVVAAELNTPAITENPQPQRLAASVTESVAEDAWEPLPIKEPEPDEKPKEKEEKISPEELAKLEKKYAALPALTPKMETKPKTEKKTPFSGEMQSFLPVAGALLLVVGLFLAFALILKKVTPKSMRGLPKEAFEVLGQANLTPKLQLHLIRIGNHLSLVSVSADCIQSVAEITDINEVAFVLGVFKKHDPQGSSAAFKRVLKEMEQEPLENVNNIRVSSKPVIMARLPESQRESEEESLASILTRGARRR